MQCTITRSITVLLVGGVLGAPFQTFASGFALIEQSGSGMGKAFAGMAATTDDASSLFYNPATISKLQGSNASVAGHYVVPKAEFTDDGSVTAGSAPLTGGNGGDAGVPTLVPNFYITKDLGEGLHTGVGVTVPFGLATAYDPGWKGRYHAQLSDLQTISVSPTIALRPSDRFSIGASLNIEYASAQLTNRLDMGSYCCGVTPQLEDGSVQLKGSDIASGFTLGALFTHGETRIGLSYRSSVTHKLEGQADFTLTANAASSLGKSTSYSEDATATLVLPETASLAVVHRLSDSIELSGDITRTRWSRFEKLAIDFDNPAQPDSSQPENWRDTNRYSLGVSYRSSQELVLRAGAAFDQTPVPNAEYRTPRVPDSDRTWISLGAGYRVTDTMSVDVGYSHIFMSDTKINNTEEFSNSVLKGTYTSSIDILSAQVNMRF